MHVYRQPLILVNYSKYPSYKCRPIGIINTAEHSRLKINTSELEPSSSSRQSPCYNKGKCGLQKTSIL